MTTKRTARRMQRQPTARTSSGQLDHAAGPAAHQEPRTCPMIVHRHPLVYLDTLRQVTVVVETPDGLWLVPRRQGGWAGRQKLTLTAEAKAERLMPARDVTPAWLGADAGRRCEISTEASAEQQT